MDSAWETSWSGLVIAAVLSILSRVFSIMEKQKPLIKIIPRKQITPEIVRYQCLTDMGRLVYHDYKNNLAIQIEIPTKEVPYYMHWMARLMGAEQRYYTDVDENELILEEEKALFYLTRECIESSI